LLESDLAKLNFDDNYYFCFSNLELSPDLIKNELINFSFKEDRVVFNNHEFKEIIKTAL